MNIAKQREILSLREEARNLVREYDNKKELALEIQTPKLLDSALSEFITYIRQQGFAVSGNREGTLLADSSDGIIITLHRIPKMLAVTMPNGEYYEVTVVSTLEEALLLEDIEGLSQDRQISEYNFIIEKTKKQISLIEKALYRYCLYIQPRAGHPGGKKFYPKFSDVLTIMFS